MVVMTLTPYYDVDDELEKEDKPLVPSLTCHECAERNVLLKPFFLANNFLKYFVDHLGEEKCLHGKGK